jgi:hypothetical protein
MKGIPLSVYIDETGEFRRVPDPSACADKEGAKILDVFKMPDDRSDVWGTRLDHEETLAKCKVIEQQTAQCPRIL